MKSMVRFLALAMVAFLVGCAAHSGTTSGTASGDSSAADSKATGTVKMLTDEDYKRIGVKEVDR